MRVNNLNSNFSFGKVFAVAGTNRDINKLENIIEKAPGDVLILDATDLYKITNTNGKCSEAVKQGKTVDFFVTGKEDRYKVLMMESGWSTLSGVSQHIGEFIDINDIQSTAEKIKKAMKK